MVFMRNTYVFSQQKNDVLNHRSVQKKKLPPASQIPFQINPHQLPMLILYLSLICNFTSEIRDEMHFNNLAIPTSVYNLSHSVTAAFFIHNIISFQVVVDFFFDRFASAHQFEWIFCVEKFNQVESRFSFFAKNAILSNSVE